jgi:hypothetical protein
MLNYELARVINLERERDIKRTVRERSLRVEAMSARSAVQESVRRPAAESAGAASLAVSRSR